MPFFTPGAAAASSLDDILTRQKAEARQAMLDQLNQKNVQSEIQSRDENSKWMALQRQAMADKYKADEDQRQVGLLDNSGAGIDEDVTGRFSPSIEGVGREYGRIQNRMVPNPQGETPDTLDQHQFFTGTPKQHENRAIDQSIDESTPSMLDAVSPENRPLVAALIKSHRANHTIVPPAEMTPFIRGTQSNKIYVTDRNGLTHEGSPTGPVVDHVPVGAVVRQVPAAPSAPPTHQWTGKGPDGKEHSFLLDNQGNIIKEIMIPNMTDLRAGNQPVPSHVVEKPLIDPTTDRKLSDLRALAKTSPTRKNLNALYTHAYSTVAGSNADESTKALVNTIIKAYEGGHPDTRSTEDIVKALTNPTTTEKEKKDLRNLLRRFRDEGPIEGQ